MWGAIETTEIIRKFKEEKSNLFWRVIVEEKLFWAITAIGALTLIGVFVRMKKGFGPFNLRIVGIVLVATLTSLLALLSETGITAAMGILGAIVGYMFGLRDSA